MRGIYIQEEKLWLERKAERKEEKRNSMAKKNKILKEMKPTFKLAGSSITSSLLGGALQPQLPARVQNPLITAGRVTGRFLPPIAILGVMSFTTKKLKKLEKKLKGRKK